MIELKITGNHATDIAAEVQNLAAIFGGTPTAAFVPTPGTEKKEVGATSKSSDSTTSAPSQQAAKSTETQSTGGKTERTLSRKEQDEAVKDMVENGEKDSRYDMLTKGRRDEVDAAIEKKAASKSTGSDVDDMFDDEPKDEVVTREQVSELMGKVCKDKDGNAIQERALKVREILVDAIPEGEEIKVRNVPENKLAEVFAAIKKVGG